MTKNLNLCEILSPQLLSEKTVAEIVEKATEREDFKVDRIHLGSNFCSQFFLKTSPHWRPVFEYAEEQGLPITLTLPIFSQKDLKAAKDVVRELMEEDSIDEVTVNDLGMLDFISRFDTKVNLGRLFFKDPRDIRIPRYYHSETVPGWLSQMDNFGNISGIELDRITEGMTVPEGFEDLTVSLHYPYTYMTTGNICKFASVNKDLEYKFRPNDSCSLECSRLHEFFVESFEKGEESELFRFGRSVYYLNETEPRTSGIDRLVYFPLKELALA